MNDDEKMIAEYKEATADIRLHSTVIWAQLTVYLAAMGGLVQVVSARPNMRALDFIGILLSALFWIICERGYDWVHCARNRAKTLESSLGFALHSSWPPPRIPGGYALNAYRVVFSVGFLGWLSALIWL